MATKTFYFLYDTLASGSGSPGFGSMQDGGSAPGNADSNSSWTMPLSPSNVYSPYLKNTAQGSGTFTATVEPDGSIAGNTEADCLRSQNAYTGSFNAGNWVFTFGVRPGDNTGGGKAIVLRIRVYRSTNADGTGATEITSSTQISTPIVTDSQTTTISTTVTWNAPAITLSNEYIFVQLAAATTGVNGTNGWTGTLEQGATYSLLTPDFGVAPLSSFYWFHEWAYPYGAFAASKIRRHEPLFADPTFAFSVGGQPPPIEAFDEQRAHFPNGFRIPYNRRFSGEHDDFFSQSFTQPSAPVAGWVIEQDARPNYLAQPLRLGSESRDIIAVFSIGNLPYTPADFPRIDPSRGAFMSNARLSYLFGWPLIPTQQVVDLGQFAMWNVTPQRPNPPSRKPLEDQHARCVTLDIGDLLTKAWPAPTQCRWERPQPMIRDSRHMVQAFDPSIFQPAQIPPMLPWDGLAGRPQRVIIKLPYSDAGQTILVPGTGEEQSLVAAWGVTPALPARSVRMLPSHVQAQADAPAFFPLEQFISGWNAPHALPMHRWTPRILAGDMVPIPKVPISTGELGPWNVTWPGPQPVPVARRQMMSDSPRYYGMFQPEPIAWFNPWPDRIIPATRQHVAPVDHKNFLVSSEAAYFLVWDSGTQTPVRYPPASAARSQTDMPVFPIAQNLVIVAGPYFVFQGQIYIAGSVEGDLSSE